MIDTEKQPLATGDDPLRPPDLDRTASLAAADSPPVFRDETPKRPEQKFVSPDVVAWREKRQQKKEAEASLMNKVIGNHLAVRSSDQTPEGYAEAMRLGKTLNRPAGVVALDVDHYRAMDGNRKLSQIMDQFPGTARFLAEKENATIADHDWDALTKIERESHGWLYRSIDYTFSMPNGRNNTALGSVISGFQKWKLGHLGTSLATSELNLENTNYALVSMGQASSDDWMFPHRDVEAKIVGAAAKEAKDTAKYYNPPQEGNFVSGVSSGIESFVAQSISMLSAFGPGGPGTALGLMSLGQAGQSYLEAREKGIDPRRAMSFGTGMGMIEGITEKLPLTRLLNDVSKGVPLWSTFKRQLLPELASEQIATVAQDAWEIPFLHPTKTFADYMKERPDAAEKTLWATLVGVGGNVTVMKSVDAVITPHQEKLRRAEAAQQQAAYLQNLAQTEQEGLSRSLDLLAGTKMYQLAPEKAGEAFALTTGVETLHVDAATLNQTVLQSGQNWAQPLLDNAALMEQVRVAEAAGETVAIPSRDLIAHVPMETLKTLLPDLHVRPDGVTPRMAEQEMTAATQEFNQRLETARDELANGSTVDPIYADVETQLRQAGRKDREAAATAALWSERYKTRATRLSEALGKTIDPVELYQQDNLRIQQGGNGKSQFNQALENYLPRGMVRGDGADLAAMYRGETRDDGARAIFLGPTTEKLATDIPALADFSHSVDRYALNHFANRHSNEKIELSRGQIAITDKDVAAIPDIISNYDAVRRDLINGRGNPVVAYAKQVDDGILIYLEEIRGSRKDMAGLSLWKMRPTGTNVSAVLQRAAPESNVRNGGRHKGIVTQNTDAFYENLQNRAQGQGKPKKTFYQQEDLRPAKTFAEARQQAENFKDKPITNADKGMPATVSGNSLDKMLNNKAAAKSSSARDHALAVANADHLYETAIHGWAKTKDLGNPHLKAVHRFFSVLPTEDGPRLVKLTVKEFKSKSDGNRLYTVESIDVETVSPTAQWVTSLVKSDGLDPTSIQSVGDVISLAKAVEDGKVFQQDAADRVPGTGLEWVKQAVEADGYAWDDVGPQKEVSPAVERVDATIKSDGLNPTSILGTKRTHDAEDVLNLAKAVEDGKVFQQDAADRVPSTDEFYRDLLGDGRGRDDGVFHQDSEGRDIGPFGPILLDFKGDAQGAIAKLTEMETGEAIAALHHPDIGDIDLVWGKEGTGKSDGYGLAKIAKYHPEVLGDLQGILSSTKVKSRSKNRIKLESEEHEASVSLNYYGQAKQWLLTEFKKDKEGGSVTTMLTDEITGKDNSPTTASDSNIPETIKKFHQEEDGGTTRIDTGPVTGKDDTASLATASDAKGSGVPRTDTNTEMQTDDSPSASSSDAIVQQRIEKFYRDLEAASPYPVVADLTGEELAPFGTDIKAIRERAIAFYRQTLSSMEIPSKALGKTVEFSSKGLRKAINSSAMVEKLQMFPAIGSIIEQGQKVDDAGPDGHKHEPSTKKYHYLRAIVRLDGKPYEVGLTVREDTNGNFYYNHIVENREDLLGGRLSARKAGPMSKEVLNQSIAEFDDNVNLFIRPLQRKRAQIRASVTFGADGIDIRLFKTANVSSMLHETGHVFVQQLIDDVALIKAQPGYDPTKPGKMERDLQVLLGWMGAKNAASITTEQHEKFARGFEQYLRDGKAPSPGLRRAFHNFRKWLTRLYTRMTDLRVEVSPEIKAVMDRLLAVDAAIAAQQAQNPPLLKTKPDSMTKAEWAAYQARVEQAEMATTEAVTRWGLADLDPEDSPLRSIKDAVRQRVEAAMKTLPVWRAVRLINGGDGRSGPLRLNRDEVRRIAGQSALMALDSKRNGVLLAAVGKDGVHPQDVADAAGYPTAEAMLNDLAGLPSRQDYRNQTVQAVLAERFGAFSEDNLPQAVQAALLNPAQAAVLDHDWTIAVASSVTPPVTPVTPVTSAVMLNLVQHPAPSGREIPSRHAEFISASNTEQAEILRQAVLAGSFPAVQDDGVRDDGSSGVRDDGSGAGLSLQNRAQGQGKPKKTFYQQEDLRPAKTFAEARQQAENFKDKPITNADSGMVGTVSSNGLGKMLSDSAMKKSSSAQDHLLAVANVDHLFETALYGWSKKDRDNDPNIKNVHRFFSVLATENGPRLVKLTVKEYTSKEQGNKIYSIESIDFNEKSPAVIWVDATIKSDGLDPTSIRPAGDILNLAKSVEEGKVFQQDAADRVPSTDEFYRDLLGDGRSPSRHAEFISASDTAQAEIPKQVVLAGSFPSVRDDGRGRDDKGGVGRDDGSSGRGGAVAAAREVARATLVGQRPDQAEDWSKHLRAALRAGQEADAAYGKGELELAVKAKSRQIMAYALAREGKKTVAEMGKARRYLRMLLTSQQARLHIGTDAMAQIDALMMQADVPKPDGFIPVAATESRAAWQARMADLGYGGMDSVPPKPWLNMTVGDVQDFIGTLKHMEHVGRTENQLLLDGETQPVGEIAAKMAAAVRTGGASEREAGVGALASRHNLMLRPEKVVEFYDRGDGHEAFHRCLWQPLKQAQQAKADRMAAVMTRVNPLLETRRKENPKGIDKSRYVIANRVMTHDHLLAVGLNLGTHDNRAALMQGYGWNEAVLALVKGKLTKADWDFIQGVWDLFATLYPDLSAVEATINGMGLPKVETAPVETLHGTYRGGFYPLLVNPSRPDLSLDPSLAIKSLESSVHDITHTIPVSNARKLLNNAELQAALVESYGVDAVKTWQGWLARMASGPAHDDPVQGFAHALTVLRLRATVAGVSHRLAAVVNRAGGLAQAMTTLGSETVMRGFAKVYLNRWDNIVAAWDQCTQLSPVFRNRKAGLERAMQQTMRQTMRQTVARGRGKTNSAAVAEHWACTGLAVTDQALTLGVWHGAYDRHLETHPGDGAGAAAFADAVITKTQEAMGVGSDAMMDLAPLVHSPEWAKLVTLLTTPAAAVPEPIGSILRAMQQGPGPVRAQARHAFMLLGFVYILPDLLLGHATAADGESLLHGAAQRAAFGSVGARGDEGGVGRDDGSSSPVMLNSFQHLTPSKREIPKHVVLASSFPAVQDDGRGRDDVRGDDVRGDDGGFDVPLDLGDAAAFLVTGDNP